MGRAVKDLTGKDFGAIHVFRRAGSSPKGAALWECYCGKCGGTSVIEGSRLLAGKTDCGCVYKERRADLSGKHFGALHVIKRTGSSNSGDALYLCRCDLCGQEKEFPATTIRKELKSCGCQQYNSERMKEMSALGVAAMVKDGVNVYTATKTEPMKNNKLGIRGVRYDEKRHCYTALCVVHGERWFGYGFDSAEAAKAARDKAQNELFAKYGVEYPLLTLKQYAQKYGYSLNTMYRYISIGVISENDVVRVRTEGARGLPRIMIRYDAKPSYPPDVLKQLREYASDNPDKTSEAHKIWREQHPKKVKEYRRKYYEEHKEEVKARVAANQKAKKACHPGVIQGGGLALYLVL